MDLDYCLSELKALLAIDSPSGFTDRAADHLMQALESLGYRPEKTRKGGVLCCLGGEGDGLLLMAHVDTLGGIVSSIKPNGRLQISPVGGLRAENCEAENCRIYSRFSGTYTGTLQIVNASVHVNDDYAGAKRTFRDSEIVIDENVRTAEAVRALGIAPGDFVCFDPRTVITESGYVSSTTSSARRSCSRTRKCCAMRTGRRSAGFICTSRSTRKSATAPRPRCRTTSPRCSASIWAASATG